MVGSIKDLLAGAQAGDVLVFTNSSHGSYVPDRSGDEPKYDEIICPYDIMQSVLTDDELRGLFADLPDGVSLTVISDSCFSGTVTRAAPFRSVTQRWTGSTTPGRTAALESPRAAWTTRGSTTKRCKTW